MTDAKSVAEGPLAAAIEAAEKGEYMSSEQKGVLRDLLQERRRNLMNEVDRTVRSMHQETDHMPDEHDRASLEEHFAVELKTRDRERKLLAKLDQTLVLLESERYGYCGDCGEEIGFRRLCARPTATLCIECKQFHERLERR